MSDKNISIVVRLKDQVTSQLKKIKSEAKSVQSQVKKKTALEVNTSKATSALKKVDSTADKTKSKLKSISKTPVTVNAKDKVSGIISRIKDRFRGIKSTPAVPITGKDRISGIIASAKSGILGLKALAAGVAIVATVSFVGEQMIKPGAELMNQKVSMTHFMGGDEKGANKYIAELRKEADRTPFSTGELIQAGTRSIGLTGGDTKQAMDLVKISEDMASLTPGKTVMDAMEAIADARMGEFERLKEFNFKGTKENFDAAGGDLTKMKSTDGKTLSETFGGGADKLSKTPSGIWSTITGNIESGLQDAGVKILEAVAPVLESFVPLSEKAGPAITSFVTALVNLVSFIGGIFAPAFESLKTAFSEIGIAMQPFLQKVGEVGSIILPVLGEVLSATVVPALQGLFQIVSTVAQIVFPALEWAVTNIVIPAVKLVADFFRNSLLPAIEKVKAWFDEHLSPAISKAVGWLKDNLVPAIEKVWGWLEKLGSALSGALDAVQSFGSGIRDAIGGAVSSIGSALGIGDGVGAFATGLQRVPHDDFVARLHKDEAVVPAVSNPYNPRNKLPANTVKLASVPFREEGKGNKSYNINIHINGRDKDDSSIVDEMVDKLELALDNM